MLGDRQLDHVIWRAAPALFTLKLNGEAAAS